MRQFLHYPPSFSILACFPWSTLWHTQAGDKQGGIKIRQNDRERERECKAGEDKSVCMVGEAIQVWLRALDKEEERETDRKADVLKDGGMKQGRKKEKGVAMDNLMKGG